MKNQIALLGLVVGFSSLTAPCAIAEPDANTLVKVGDPAPSFVGTAIDGSQISLDNMRGQVVVLDFFATW